MMMCEHKRFQIFPTDLKCLRAGTVEFKIPLIWFGQMISRQSLKDSNLKKNMLIAK